MMSCNLKSACSKPLVTFYTDECAADRAELNCCVWLGGWPKDNTIALLCSNCRQGSEWCSGGDNEDQPAGKASLCNI